MMDPSVYHSNQRLKEPAVHEPKAGIIEKVIMTISLAILAWIAIVLFIMGSWAAIVWISEYGVHFV